MMGAVVAEVGSKDGGREGGRLLLNVLGQIYLLPGERTSFLEEFYLGWLRIKIL
jgi:hypothetical protein